MADNISIEDLRMAINMILDHIEKEGNTSTLKIDKDFYWEITEDDMFKIGVEPKIIGVGSLFQDIDFVKSIINDKTNTFGAMLMHVAPLLKYISTFHGR